MPAGGSAGAADRRVREPARVTLGSSAATASSAGLRNWPETSKRKPSTASASAEPDELRRASPRLSPYFVL